MRSTRNVCFLDTNVLIYAAAGAKDEPEKWRIAHEVISEERASISAQVLQEFYYNVTRPGRLQLDREEVHQWVERLALFPMVEIDIALVLKAIAIAERYLISYWDGAILAAAHSAGASVLYTEDLRHGQLYGSVRVVNPFESG